MRRILGIFLRGITVLFFSGGMFYCFVAGAPSDPGGVKIYIFSAGVFSLILPIFVYICIRYIFYLHKKLKDAEKEEK